MRLIFASAYDIFVGVTANDVLLPDSRFYSMSGRYISCLLNGYDRESFTKDMAPPDRLSQAIFAEIVNDGGGRPPPLKSESGIYYYVIGFIYFIFGYFPLGVRIFNIALSIAGTYFMFRIAKRQFGDIPANIFLIIALFLPTQFGYSITLSKDFIRMFMVCIVLWAIYG